MTDFVKKKLIIFSSSYFESEGINYLTQNKGTLDKSHVPTVPFIFLSSVLFRVVYSIIKISECMGPGSVWSVNKMDREREGCN